MKSEKRYISRDHLLTRTNILGLALVLSFVYEIAFLSLFSRDLAYLVSIKSLALNAAIFLPFMGAGAFLLVDTGKWIGSKVERDERFQDTWFFKLHEHIFFWFVLFAVIATIALLALGRLTEFVTYASTSVTLKVVATLIALDLAAFVVLGTLWRVGRALLELDRDHRIASSDLVEILAYAVVFSFLLGTVSALTHRGTQCKFVSGGENIDAKLLLFMDSDVVAQEGNDLVIINRSKLDRIICPALGHRGETQKD